MQNRLLRSLLIFNGILSILAVCPVYPTIPTTSIPKTNPLVLTSTSEGMISFNPSLSQLAITTTITLDEECPPGSVWNIFTLTVTPTGDSEKELLRVYVPCDSGDVMFAGDWIGSERTIAFGLVHLSESKILNIFVSLDLASNEIFTEINSKEHYTYLDLNMQMAPQSWNFDLTTKLYLCSDLKSALSCTVSRLQLAPVSNQYPGHLGAFTPVSQAFYPLKDGKLSSLVKSTDSASFGDSASFPTSGSSPSWDSSNSFVQISSQTQFLTFPLPLIPQDPILATTMTVSLWIRMTSFPPSEATILSLIKDDGTPVYSLTVKETKHSKLTFGGTNTFFYPPLSISLNTWQFLTFTLYIPPGFQYPIIKLSVGHSSSMAIPEDLPDLSAALLRVGDPVNSFIGDISAVRILSPAEAPLISKNDDICSSNNSAGPCPIHPVTPFTETSEALCLSFIEPNDPDNSHEEVKAEEEEITKQQKRKGKGKQKRHSISSDSDSIKAEESGLSVADIAAIAIGSMVGVATVGAIGSFLQAKIAPKNRASSVVKISTESTIDGPSIVITMHGVEGITVEDQSDLLVDS